MKLWIYENTFIRVRIPYKPGRFSGFLFAAAEVVYIINCDDLPSCNPNTDSCLPQTWIVLAFPKVSPGFSGFDEYTQDVPRSIAWSGAHWLWFSLHDMIGGSYIRVSRAWFSVICQIKRTIMRLGKYNWYCVNKGKCFFLSFQSVSLHDSFIYWVLWIYKLSLKGASRSLVIFLFFLEHLVVAVCCCTIVFLI